MDLQDLRTFEVLAEELSWAAAARRMRLSEQGLSKRVQRVEQRLGVELFTRTGPTLELTPAGRWLLSWMTAVVQEWNAAADQAHLFGAGPPEVPAPGAVPRGEEDHAQDRSVRLAIPEFSSGTLQGYLSTAMPAHRVVVTAMPTLEALERLATGDGVDVVLVYDPSGAPIHPAVEGTHVATVVVSPIWVLMGAGHRLAAQGEVTFEDVAAHGLPWAISPPSDLLRTWEEELILSRTPQAQLHDTTPQSLVAISQGRAVALASPGFATTELLTLRPLAPSMAMHEHLTWRPDQVPAAVVGELLTAMRGFDRRWAQRNPRYWRWINEHPDAFPGIAPEPAGESLRMSVTGPGGVLDVLTSREREVLTLVVAGYNDTEIGHELQLSPQTAKKHVTNIRTKLGARDRVQLVVFAHQNHLLD